MQGLFGMFSHQLSTPDPRRLYNLYDNSTTNEAASALSQLETTFEAFSKMVEALPKASEIKNPESLKALKDQLQTIYEFLANAVPDPVILSDVQKRPVFHNFLHTMLGNNREQDDLRLIQHLITKLRKLFLERMTEWKAKMKAPDSLAEELEAAKLPHSLSGMTTHQLIDSLKVVVDQDLDALFQQIEANIRVVTERFEERERTLENKVTTLEDSAKGMVQKQQELQETANKAKAALEKAQLDLLDSHMKEADLTADLNRAKATLAKLHQENQAISPYSVPSKGEMESIRRENERLHTINQVLKKQLEETQGDIRELGDECTTKAASIKVLNEERLKYKIMGKELKAKLEEATKAFDDNLAIERVRREQAEKGQIAYRQQYEELVQQSIEMGKIIERAQMDRVVQEMALQFIETLSPELKAQFQQLVKAQSSEL